MDTLQLQLSGSKQRGLIRHSQLALLDLYRGAWQIACIIACCHVVMLGQGKIAIQQETYVNLADFDVVSFDEHLGFVLHQACLCSLVHSLVACAGWK